MHVTAPAALTARVGNVKLRVMLDSGASIHLFQTDAMFDAATQLSSSEPLGHINGVGGRTNITAMLGARLHLADGGVIIVLKAPFARGSEGSGAAAQDILSTGKLFDDTGIITMLDPKPHLRMPSPSQTCVPLIRDGRYYMLEVEVSPLPPAVAQRAQAPKHSNAAFVALARSVEAPPLVTLDASPLSTCGAAAATAALTGGAVDEAATSLDDNDVSAFYFTAETMWKNNVASIE